MPLLTAEPPADVARGAMATLGQQAERRALRLPGLASAAPDTLQLTAPHPVYNLDLDELAERRGLAAARLTGWRFLITAGSSVLAAAEVAADGTTGAGEFSHINAGPFVDATTRAQAIAEQLPEVTAGRYELRLLRAPGLYVMALWLKDLRGEHDLVLPMAPAPAPLEAGHAYAASQLTELLAGPAQRQIDQQPAG